MFQLFCRLQPDFVKEKIVFVNGDMTLPGLGITEEDRNVLKNEVNIVFHSAASTNFGAHLRQAVAINLQGTEKVLQLAQEMKNIQVMQVNGKLIPFLKKRTENCYLLKLRRLVIVTLFFQKIKKSFCF